MAFWSDRRDPYRAVRLKLFGIQVGALLAIWLILLSIVYVLMSSELYRVLDSELRRSAIQVIQSYDRSHLSAQSVNNQSDFGATFSLWQITGASSTMSATYIDGTPFIDVRTVYHNALTHPSGYSTTLQINGQPYRIFDALVNLKHGTYLIQVDRSVGPTQVTLSSLISTLIIAGMAALILTLIGGLILTTRSMTPLLASWRQQQQFIADASHELRTPFAIIRSNLDVLLHHPHHTIESEMTYLGNAYEEVERTSALLENLLTLARAESHEQILNLSPVALSDLAKDVVESTRPLAEWQQKSITLNAPENPCMVIGDAARLRQLMLILIDNALRYSDAGACVVISVSCDTTSCELHVQDDGIGIPQNLLPRIFDRFVRADPSRHRAEQGSGLGLAIAKWIIEAHKGQVFVQSKEGRGTTFTVIFPS